MPANDAAGAPDPAVLVALPGTGSDADYIRRAFGPAAASLGVDLIAPEPANDLVGGYRAALDAAAGEGRPILVGGVSIGAAIALDWALDAGRSRCCGVLAALPAWSGSPEHAAAAHSATLTASSIERDGLEPTIGAMTATSPEWLAAELTRSWRGLADGLVTQLRCGAAYRAPGPAEIADLGVPLAVTAAIDDPVHPIGVARQWCAAAPRSALVEVTLAGWGARPALLGDSCARAWAALHHGQQDPEG